MIKIGKTDGRHTGNKTFAYYAEVRREYRVPGMSAAGQNFKSRAELLMEYNALRKWCVDTWGMSCDRTHYLEIELAEMSGLNVHWSWHTEYNELKIYLKSDKEANWMKLRWG